MATPKKYISRWWKGWLVVCLLAGCLGCSERRLAPELTYDSENVESLRDSFDNFFQPND